MNAAQITEHIEALTNAAYWSGVLTGIGVMVINRALGAWFEGRLR